MTDVRNARLRGVLSPVVTPFGADLQPDASRLARHCRWLLDQDVGLAVFGTNSEANSISVGEKIGLLEALLEAGLPPGRMMPGTGCCAFPDTVELTRAAVRSGCAGVLMLPPFYYKNVSEPANTSKPDLANASRKAAVFFQSPPLSFMPAVCAG